jgi:hypothetical protein
MHSLIRTSGQQPLLVHAGLSRLRLGPAASGSGLVSPTAWAGAAPGSVRLRYREAIAANCNGTRRDRPVEAYGPHLPRNYRLSSHSPTAERTMDPARMLKESLTSRPELENSQASKRKFDARCLGISSPPALRAQPLLLTSGVQRPSSR